MLFTHIDRELCLVYPPAFVGPERLTILHRKKGATAVREQPDLFTALAQVGMTLEPVLAGGSRRLTQEREQWASGCNALALAPGVILTYARNVETLKQLEQAGFAVTSSADGEREDSARAPRREAITIKGGELVRGGGGARCMTLPILREDP
jgi:arginine deiminase